MRVTLSIVANGYIQRLFEYNTWANRGLLEFLGTVPRAALDEHGQGVYGSIWETLEHMLSSELAYERYLEKTPKTEIERPEEPDIGWLVALAERSGNNLARIVDALPDASETMHLGDGDRAAATILVQLITHSAEHRGHVRTILGTLGIQPLELDSWAHGIFAHGDEWPEDWGRKLEPLPLYPPVGLS